MKQSSIRMTTLALIFVTSSAGAALGVNYRNALIAYRSTPTPDTNEHSCRAVKLRYEFSTLPASPPTAATDQHTMRCQNQYFNQMLRSMT